MGKVISIEKARGGPRFKPQATRGLRAAATPPTSFDPKARTFTFVLATERPCRTYRWAGWDVVEVDEVLPMSDLVEIERLVGSPILNSHSSWNLRDVIGVITGAQVEGDKLVCTGQLSERSDVADIARDIGAGVLTSMSVGFQIVEDGLAFERDGDVPLVTVKRWKALEASVVPVPADDDAKIRGGRRPSTRNTAPRQGARGMTPDELKTLLNSTFSTVTDTLVSALTVDDGEPDLDAEADAAAEEARAAFLAKRSGAKPGQAPTAPVAGERSAAEKATILGLRTACAKRGLGEEFKVMEESGATIAELRGVLAAGLRTNGTEIDGTTRPSTNARSGKLISFDESGTAKRQAKK